MKLKKRAITLFLSGILFLSLLVPLRGQTTSLSVASSLQTGEYVFVLPQIQPTGWSHGDYYMRAERAVNPGMRFAEFNINFPNSLTYWKVTRISASQCTVQDPSKGENGYLNLSAQGGLVFGPKQNLNYSFSEGKFKFYVVEGGVTYYIRFTNRTNNEPRFHCGADDSSTAFYLYQKETLATSNDADRPLPTEDPLLTVACISDLHADYGLQSRSPYVRNCVITTLRRIGAEEDADIVLFGGDNTSDNAGLSERGGWSYQTYQKVIAAYGTLAGEATESGRSLWAAGNHDYQAGEDDGYDSYAGYESIMKEGCGDPISVYRQKDDRTLSDQRYPDYIMGLHYNVEGFDFIVLNAPYSKALCYSTGTLQWLRNRLAAIGEDRTVFLLTHYPFDAQQLTVPDYGLSGEQYTAMKNVLQNYPNVIYLYGHNHGRNDSVYISQDTFERIDFYTKSGKVVNNRNVIPTSFITSFMGSMSYYRNSLDPDTLSAQDPQIVQALMIYVYRDRIVFQMKNYGSHSSHANRILKPWTVMRDVAGSLNLEDDSSSNPSTDSSGSSNSNPSQGSQSSQGTPTDSQGGAGGSLSLGSTDGAQGGTTGDLPGGGTDSSQGGMTQSGSSDTTHEPQDGTGTGNDGTGNAGFGTPGAGDEAVFSVAGVMMAVAGGVIALGGLGTLSFVLVRMWKKDREDPDGQ